MNNYRMSPTTNRNTENYNKKSNATEKQLGNQYAKIEELVKQQDKFNLHKKLKETGDVYTIYYISLYIANNRLILDK